MQILDALPDLLPPVAYDGRAATVQRELAALAAVLGDVQLAADALQAEHRPDQAVVALGDWERNYGLPDTCSGGASQTIEQRRVALLQRIAGRGNLSRAFMLALAEAVGYPGATITEFGPTTCEHPCDAPLMGFDWVGVWQMVLLQATSITEATCEGTCDSPLRVFGNTQLECVINRRKPAHTQVMFSYAP